MLKPFLSIAIATCMLASCNNQQTTGQTIPTETEELPATQEQGSVLRHVVLFKFKDTSTPEQVRQVEQAFAALPERIDAIQDLEWGTNVSPENHAQGYTHCFLVTFRNEADRDAYLPHPAHKEFGSMVGPHIDKVLVVDFLGAK
jgi:hypothetical protein